MKTKLILKALSDLPGNTLPLAVSAPERALNLSKQLLAPSA